jgi:hypothetical protein
MFYLLIIVCLKTFAQNYPLPPASPNRLFYIQRSNNAHTVIYDANWTKDRKLNVKNPVNVYWIRYDEKVHTQNLSIIEKALAFGVETTPNSNKNDSFDVRVMAFKKRIIKLKLNENGQAIATMFINGLEGQLHKVFVQLEEGNDDFRPSVKYIEIFGKNLVTGAEIYEKFKP